MRLCLRLHRRPTHRFCGCLHHCPVVVSSLWLLSVRMLSLSGLSRHFIWPHLCISVVGCLAILSVVLLLRSPSRPLCAFCPVAVDSSGRLLVVVVRPLGVQPPPSLRPIVGHACPSGCLAMSFQPFRPMRLIYPFLCVFLTVCLFVWLLSGFSDRLSLFVRFFGHRPILPTGRRSVAAFRSLVRLCLARPVLVPRVSVGCPLSGPLCWHYCCSGHIVSSLFFFFYFLLMILAMVALMIIIAMTKSRITHSNSFICLIRKWW